MIVFVSALGDQNDYESYLRSNIKSIDFTLGMERYMVKVGQKIRDSMKSKIKQIENEEKMRQEKNMEKQQRQIIRKYLLNGVHAPVLNDFYSRF